MAGKYDDFHFRIHLVKYFKHFQAVHILHFQIQNRHIKIHFAKCLNAFLTTEGSCDIKISSFQSFGKNFDEAFFIINKKKFNLFRKTFSLSRVIEPRNHWLPMSTGLRFLRSLDFQAEIGPQIGSPRR